MADAPPCWPPGHMAVDDRLESEEFGAGQDGGDGADLVNDVVSLGALSAAGDYVVDFTEVALSDDARLFVHPIGVAVPLILMATYGLAH